jgi:hypothetical protein
MSKPDPIRYFDPTSGLGGDLLRLSKGADWATVTSNFCSPHVQADTASAHALRSVASLQTGVDTRSWATGASPFHVDTASALAMRNVGTVQTGATTQPWATGASPFHVDTASALAMRGVGTVQTGATTQPWATGASPFQVDTASALAMRNVGTVQTGATTQPWATGASPFHVDTASALAMRGVGTVQTGATTQPWATGASPFQVDTASALAMRNVGTVQTGATTQPWATGASPFHVDTASALAMRGVGTVQTGATTQPWATGASPFHVDTASALAMRGVGTVQTGVAHQNWSAPASAFQRTSIEGSLAAFEEAQRSSNAVWVKEQCEAEQLAYREHIKSLVAKLPADEAASARHERRSFWDLVAAVQFRAPSSPNSLLKIAGRRQLPAIAHDRTDLLDPINRVLYPSTDYLHVSRRNRRATIETILAEYIEAGDAVDESWFVAVVEQTLDLCLKTSAYLRVQHKNRNSGDAPSTFEWVHHFVFCTGMSPPLAVETLPALRRAVDLAKWPLRMDYHERDHRPAPAGHSGERCLPGSPRRSGEERVSRNSPASCRHVFERRDGIRTERVQGHGRSLRRSPGREVGRQVRLAA